VSPEVTPTVVTSTILSDGEEMDDSFEVVSIDCSKEVDRIPVAQIKLLDGNASTAEFPISDTAFFEPGKEIEIKLRYEGKGDTTVFKGLVVRHGIEADHGESWLTVELKDAATKLTQTRKSAVFSDMSDSDIIEGIIGEHDLAVGTLDATSPTHPQTVQYYCTDWDFILSRADVNGLLVAVDGGKISLKKADVGPKKHQLGFGTDDVYSFEMEADAAHQFESFESVAWDVANQKATEPKTAAAFKIDQGNLRPEDIAEAFASGTYALSHPVPLAEEELQAWADARLARSRISLIRGRVAVAGSPDIELLDTIEISGMGERFNGEALVTGVRHRVSDQGWQTDLQFGLSPERFCRNPDIQEAPAAGLLPPVSGLQIGVVDAFEEDPDGEFRVKVILPGIDEVEGTVWARLACPDAGNGRGYFFRPETGDEVVVGFFNSDPRHPVILGAMYGSMNAPPEDFSGLTEDNFVKGIVTKSELKVEFDDEKKIVTITTPAENKIILNDDDKSILLSDANGNKIELGSDGIAMESAKDIMIAAQGKITIDGTGEVSVSSKADVKVEGLNINNTANAGFAAKGNATAELSASGQTTVKGAMVMIN
jgi:Rhs element Vgr protein